MKHHLIIIICVAAVLGALLYAPLAADGTSSAKAVEKGTDKQTEKAVTKTTEKAAAKTTEKTVEAPAKPKLVSVQSKKVKKATVTWEAVEGAEGYEIRYQLMEPKDEASDKEAKASTAVPAETKTVTSGTKTTATLSNLLGDREYKVKVRSFRSEDKSKADGKSKAEDNSKSEDNSKADGKPTAEDKSKADSKSKAEDNSKAGSKQETTAKTVKEGKKMYSNWSKAKTVTVKHDKWSDLQDKYAAKKKVKQLIFVKYKGNSKADLIVYKKTAKEDAGSNEAGETGKTDKTGKTDTSGETDAIASSVIWKKILSCDAYTGQNGIDKKKEGDRRTPTGDYNLTHAFGVNKDPGSKMDYIKLNKHLYWCGDKEHYNQLIDIRDYPHNCRGEHLINYTKQYAYAMAMDYNKKGTYQKGSAIFLHCIGYNPYTLGCVAVSQDNMKTILKNCGKNAKICIYKK